MAALLVAGNLAAADDLTPLQLAMPGAPVALGMNFDRIRLAYAGSRYQELLTPEYRAQYERSSKSMKDMLGFDPSQLKEMVGSVRSGPSPGSAQWLVIVSGLFDPDRAPGLLALLPTERTAYQGVPLLVTKQGKGDPVGIAFLGRTLAVVGDPPSVRSAISRWKSGTASHSPLLAKAEEMSRTYQVWAVARDLHSAAAHAAPLPKGAGGIDAALQSVEELTMGLTLVPGFEASVEFLADTPKDAASLDGALHAAVALAMSQAAPQSSKDILSGVEIASQGRTVKLSLAISEEKMIEAFKEQMKRPPAWIGGPQAPRNAEVVVQGSETTPKADAPKNAGDTQVIVLPR